jgi:aspartate/methionine/tyrosine aminotransferase
MLIYRPKTGAIYPPNLIAAFASFAKTYGIALIIDETYRDFVNPGPPHTLFSHPATPPEIDPTEPSSWRGHFVHLFSFSKSYCVPGHRLGAIVASPVFISSVLKVLDCIQICPPRPIQIALAPLLHTFRPFIVEHAKSIQQRHELFRALLPSRWKIGAQGGFFAFVKHPFRGVRAIQVSRRLATDAGVVTLPAEFFCQGGTITQAETCISVDEELAASGDSDMWIRFSVANVDDEMIRKVCQRLAESEMSFGWELESTTNLNIDATV